jgi:single-strand DNA-binding protein
MKDLNKVMIIGNLTRDPEMRMTPSGQSVASYAVATNRQWKDQSGETQSNAEFHDVVAWGKLAEIVEQYLHKGMRVYIEGRLQTRSWEGQDGVKRNKTEIVASDVIMLDRKNNDMPSSSVSEKIEEKPVEDKKAKKEDTSGDDIEEVDLDDIPF